jgi:lipid-A-disaccharide synthase
MGIKLIKIKDYSIVNILAGQWVIPELIQNRFTPENLFAEAKKILESEKIRAEMKESFQKIKTDLGETGASEKAARELERLVRTPSPVTDS